MEEPQNKKIVFRRYIYAALTLFAGLSLSILFFFILFKLPEINGFVGKLMDIIAPFIYGAVLAYVMTPIANYVERVICAIFRVKKLEECKQRGLIRGIGVFASFLFAVLVIYVLLIMVIPQATTAVTDTLEIAPKQYQKLTKWLTEVFQSNPQITAYIKQYAPKAYDYGINWSKEHLLPNISDYIGGVTGGVVSVIGLLGNLFIGAIVAIYLMADRGRFARQAKLLVYSIFKKPAADKIMEEVHYTDRTFSGYVNGKMLDSLVMFLITYVCCAIMQIPYPILMALIVSVTNMIPFFGPFIGAVPCAIIILMMSPIKCLYFIIFDIVLQQIEGNIISPKILGDSTGLNGFWVLFSIIVFGGFFGFAGMIIGVPLFAVFYHIARELVHWGLKKNGQDVILEGYLTEYDDEKAAEEKKRRKEEMRARFKRVKAAKKQNKDK